jgi:zinc D-Ala-D-Ala carboxypeptidase
MDMLQKLRDEWGAIHVSSGYRHPDYNSWVGGARRSKHMEGIAFDSPKSPEDMDDYVKLATSIGFRGIGYYNTFVHVDARLTPARWDKRR